MTMALSCHKIEYMLFFVLPIGTNHQELMVEEEFISYAIFAVITVICTIRLICSSGKIIIQQSLLFISSNI